MRIVNPGAEPFTPSGAGSTVFNDTSSAAGASIWNGGAEQDYPGGETSFNDRSTAGHATIDNYGGSILGSGGRTFFNDSSTADSAIVVAHEGDYRGDSAAIFFNGASTGGTAQVKVFGDRNPRLASTGYLDISGHQQPGVTIGSIEGSGNVYLGANNLRVGTNGLNTSFSRRDLGKRFAGESG
jgi:hypothetical protein